MLSKAFFTASRLGLRVTKPAARAVQVVPLPRFFSIPAVSPAPGSKGKVVLLYSGGLDTSTILLWLLEQGYEVSPIPNRP